MDTPEAPDLQNAADTAPAVEEAPPALDRFECRACGYIYEPEKGDSTGGMRGACHCFCQYRTERNGVWIQRKFRLRSGCQHPDAVTKKLVDFRRTRSGVPHDVEFIWLELKHP
jgi:Rubredoxin